MKNANIRALTFVVALVAIIAAGVVLAHRSTPIQMVGGLPERVDVKGGISSDRLASGLELSAASDGISLAVPNCDMSGLQASFFMHVYPASAQGAVSASFVGRDFQIAKEPAKRVATAAGLKCIVQGSYGVTRPKEVVIGQFNMPGGRCCEIIWSRTFVVEQ
jgi:hypothetical protein